MGSVVDVKTATHIIYSQDAKSRVPEEECNKHAKHVNVEVRDFRYLWQELCYELRMSLEELKKP